MYPPIMRAYTVAEISKILDVPPSTIRQWEKSLEGIFEVPRDDKNNRYYTDRELQTLRTVKKLRDKGMSFEIIRDIVSQPSEDASFVPAPSNIMPVMAQSEAMEAIHNLQQIVMTLSERVESIVQQEVRKEVTSLHNGLSNAIHNEVTSVRKEIASTSELLYKHMETLSDAMKTQQQAIETVITESRAERHKKKSFWKRILGD